MNLTIIYTTLFVFLIVLMIVTTVVFRNLWQTPSTLRNYAINLSVFTFTLTFLLLCVEIFSAIFIIHSDSFSFTLANQRWFETYWHPINRLGYRDVDYSPEDLESQQVVFVVGDSFVAGQGIPNYQDRFSNRLQTKLGDGWKVLNIAQVGWSTTEEVQAVLSHPQKPAIIILSYFIDDIRAAANRSQIQQKFSFAELIQPPPAAFAWLIQHSYFLNFFYWEWYRYHNRSPEDIYWQRLRYFYAEGDAWQIHQKELQTLVNYTRDQKISLLPILFPNLISIDLSQPLLKKVSDFFQSVGINALDLTPYFVNRPPMDLVVSRVDAHPNERVNAQVAEILFEIVNEQPIMNH